MKEQKNDGMISDTKLFAICMILLVNFIIALYLGGNRVGDWYNLIEIVQALLFFFFMFFLFIYIPYILFSTIFVYFKYKNIIYINIISIAILCTFYILYTTGFCFQEMRYLRKAELIDTMLNFYINIGCNSEYKSKHGDIVYKDAKHKDIIKECSVSLESIKQEAPQCFTDKRPNKCRGTVTHFDKKTNSVIKKEIYIYGYSKSGHGSFSSYEYIRYSISSGLDMSEDRDNISIMGCCGTIKDYYRWDW
ncbi:MAG: hypothetical protein LBP54_01240 [Campylobacteraceae bacterium]|nr:hypothetical protein [Campylobacteraceae bacterium]